MRKNDNLGFMVLISAILISGALVFFGYQYSGGASQIANFDEAIDKGIERYIQKQQEVQQKAEAEANKPKKVEDVSADDDAYLGNQNAPVTIVEFSDYQCPFCKRHFETVYPEIKSKYIDTGKVKYVFRDFPLDFHADAMNAAMAAECAGDEGNAKYFAMHDKLFQNQNALKKDDLKKYAQEIGLKMNAFNTCLDSGKYQAEVEKDLQDGKAYGVTGTPGFFINGWFIRGAQPFSAFESIIEQELAKK